MLRPSKRPRTVAFLFVALFLPSPAHGQTPTTAENYATRCAACHMLDGKSPVPGMNFVEGAWKNGNKVADIGKVIRDGIEGTAMLPFKDQLSPKEIEALARHVRAFDKRLKPDSGASSKK